MPAQLIISGSDDNNMRYATGLSINDPFIWARIGKREYVIVSALEHTGSAKPGIVTVRFHEVKYDKLPVRKGRRRNLADIAAAFLREHKVREALMPENAWASHVETLREHGVKVRLQGPFFPQRVIKTKEEIAAIRRVGTVTQAGMRRAMAILRQASVAHNKTLVWNGRTLTSEIIKVEIEKVFLEGGCASGQSIVSCGPHTALPHNYGSGPLRAGQPIIIDIYPRDTATGYYFDMTRTFVKGSPSPELKRLYAAVLASQRAGVRAVRAGAKASAVHAAAQRVFDERGYKTTDDEGFIHSTGHGLGLAIHESPGLAPRSADVLRAGMVVTVEPGLYYKGLGGVRIEDTVLVTSTGCVNLTRTPKTFVIR